MSISPRKLAGIGNVFRTRLTRPSLHCNVRSPPKALVNRRSKPSTSESGQSPSSPFRKAESFPKRVPQAKRGLLQEHYRRLGSETSPLAEFTPFPVGRKKVYLPNFVITLKRNPKLEPYHAVFEVPLNLSKLDLRDYLWHLYEVKTLSIRSSVLPGVLRRKYKVPDQPRRIGPVRRTKARKKMIVQLAKPFRYPAELNKEELEEYIPIVIG